MSKRKYWYAAREDPVDPQTCLDFFRALKDGDRESVHRFLQQDSRLANQSVPGPPLIYVLTSEQPAEIVYEILVELLDHGADVDARNAIGSTPLHFAVFRRASFQSVELLLDRGADVTAVSRGKTPLLEAFSTNNIQQDLVELVQLLLARGAGVADVDTQGCTALHLAAANGDPTEEFLSAVRLLLQHGVDSNVIDDEGYSALHRAVYNLNVEMVKVLLDYPIDINARDRFANTPLLGALFPWHLPALLDALFPWQLPDVQRQRSGFSWKHPGNGDNRDCKGYPDYEVARRHKDVTSLARTVEIVKLLLEHGADATAANMKDGSTALHYLLSARNCELMVKEVLILIPLLLDHGAYINAKDDRVSTPLHVVVHSSYAKWASDFKYTTGHVQVVRLLLDSGADPSFTNGSGNTPLHNVVRVHYNEEYAALVTMLLKHGDPNVTDNQGKTALHLAMPYYHSDDSGDKIRFLLQNKVDPNIQDNYGNTPLHTLVKTWRPRLEIINLLVEHLTDIDVKNDLGNTPLYELIDHSCVVDAIEMLLAKGADANASNKAGTSLLHRATENNRKMVVQLLLDYNATVDVKDPCGNTPLTIAVLLGHMECATLLLSRGADLNLPNCEGETPLQLMCTQESLDVLYQLICANPVKVGPALQQRLTSLPEITIVNVATPTFDVAIPTVDVAVPTMDVAVPTVDVAVPTVDVPTTDVSNPLLETGESSCTRTSRITGREDRGEGCCIIL